MRTKLSTKGQVVIPKEARDALGWTDGTVLDVVVDAGGVRLVRDNPFGPPLALEDVAGIGKRWYAGPALAASTWTERLDDVARASWGDHRAPPKRSRPPKARR